MGTDEDQSHGRPRTHKVRVPVQPKKGGTHILGVLSESSGDNGDSSSSESSDSSSSSSAVPTPGPAPKPVHTPVPTPTGMLLVPGMSNARVHATIRGMSRMLEVNDDAK